MKTPPIRSFLLALALAAVALPATAAIDKTPVSINLRSIMTIYKADGATDGGFNGGDWVGNLFDGDLTTGVRRNDAGASLVFDLSSVDTSFVTEFSVGHEGNTKYSLYYSTDGENFLPLAGAQGVQKAGLSTFSVNKEVKKLKYVFDTTISWTQSLTELAAKGYAPAKPAGINLRAYMKIYRANGTSDTGFNGGDWEGNLFDDNPETAVRRNDAGACLVFDFTQVRSGFSAPAMPNGYYLTDVTVGHVGNTKYSLYVATDPSTADNTLDGWIAVPGGTSIQQAGSKTIAVNKTAAKLKYVFETAISWTASLTDISAMGLDPEDVSCEHPSYTEWVPVADSATCTKYGVDEAFCTVCGERVTRENSTILPLGHDYETTLTTAGSVSSYGSGKIACSRCDYEIVFDNPVDLIKKGGLKADGVVQFTDLSVSSTGDQTGGTTPKNLFDGGWDMSWGNYWFTASINHDQEWVDYEFGTAIDLTMIDISVPNHDQTVEFYSVNGETETKIGEWVVSKNTADGAPGYQRNQVYFYGDADSTGATLSTLRIRVVDDIGIYYTAHPSICICELHPYGTVVGAGKKDPGLPMFILMQ
jgi:hypothetical protein